MKKIQTLDNAQKTVRLLYIETFTSEYLCHVMYVLHNSVEMVESVNSVDRTEMVLLRYLKHRVDCQIQKVLCCPPCSHRQLYHKFLYIIFFLHKTFVANFS